MPYPPKPGRPRKILMNPEKAAPSRVKQEVPAQKGSKLRMLTPQEISQRKARDAAAAAKQRTKSIGTFVQGRTPAKPSGKRAVIRVAPRGK